MGMIVHGMHKDVQELFAKIMPSYKVMSADIHLAVNEVVSADVTILLDDEQVVEVRKYFETIEPKVM